MKLKIVNKELFRVQKNVMIVFTTNGIVLNNKLVMGAGAALEAKNKFKGIDLTVASMLKYYHNKGLTDCFDYGTKKITVDKNGIYNYGFLVYKPILPGKGGVGLLQTKMHYKNPSKLSYIDTSLGILAEYIKRNNDIEVHMNYPGIGYGELKEEDVYKLLEINFEGIEDRITIFKK